MPTQPSTPFKKIIKDKKDLAINGAPPAFEKSLHVGRPNVGSREKFLDYAEQIFDRNWLTNNGPFVQEFEQRIADYHDVKHCVALCNGTIALEIAIRALDMEGEVIIPSYTFIATAHALNWQAITPVFADIKTDTHTLCPDSVKKMITPKTTGIIAVHLWGNIAEIEILQKIATEHNLKLMFDAAHAFGCTHKGKKIGRFGNCEVLSFHATKVLNSFEGGAVLTNDDELARKIKLMRNFGFDGIDNVIHSGTNGKLTEISAAMGLVNLDSVGKTIKTNKRNYELYNKHLRHLEEINILEYDTTEKNNYQYIVMEITEKSNISRDDLIFALHSENILARKYFWPGCHNMQPYKALFPNVSLTLPNTEQVSSQVIVLPTGTSINNEKIEIITKIIALLVKRSSISSHPTTNKQCIKS